ncbi:hypothetical protein M3Y99_01629500 [Aphelenchoides fujianensis]|nr:hypothetical protein M3Y99_01629500 [Aphelenchoides fujianensis]
MVISTADPTMSAERSTITATTQIVFTFGPNNEERFDAHRSLNHASEFLKNFLLMVNEPNTTVEVPLGDRADLPTLQLLNKFMKYVDENLHDELREQAHKNYFWSRKLNQKSVSSALQEQFKGRRPQHGHERRRTWRTS